MSRLQKLVEESQQETAARRVRVSLADLERLVADSPPTRGFLTALRNPGLSVIAEMKASSPSAGRLGVNYDPARLAHLYAEGGADALSVLAQATSFGGSPEHLRQARGAGPPILRKDFITEEYQVLEARVHGADAILLIVAALERPQLARLQALARELGMDVLVEVHDAAEVETALFVDADPIGVNHRDLRTLTIDLKLSERLRPLIPRQRVLVAESGIQNAADAGRMRDLGVDAVLVGEALMRSPDPAGLIRALRLR